MPAENSRVYSTADTNMPYRSDMRYGGGLYSSSSCLWVDAVPASTRRLSSKTMTLLAMENGKENALMNATC